MKKRTCLVLLCSLLCGCGVKHVDLQQLDFIVPETTQPKQKTTALDKSAQKKTLSSSGWSERVITDKELEKWSEKDPDLTVDACYEILARLNIKDRDYIRQDIKQKRKLKAPNDFIAFKKWTPMPRTVPAAATLVKFVVIAKDIPFIGWYERGRLSGDTQICIGKEWSWTQKGIYTVLEKDPSHFSQSYTNAYGDPAWMPMALRIYGRVWIHAGDVIGGYCSHGCINLPYDSAEKLFNWADLGTTVLIVDSIKDLEKDFKSYAGKIEKPGPVIRQVPPAAGIKKTEDWKMRDIYY